MGTAKAHMSVPQGPGKTAPRFIHDLICFDPANPPRSGINLLTHFPPPFHDPNTYPELTSARACGHRYVTKPNQTDLQPDHYQGGPKASYKISSICLLCCYHLELVITFRRESGLQHGPWTGHLHHLVHLPHNPNWPMVENPFRSKGQQLEAYFFECSYPTCSALVSLKLSSPLLTPQWVNLLTSTELLKQRIDEAMATRPERLEGLSRPFPINVLINLRTYIENALHKYGTKSISAGNKRFMVCFGVGGKPCKELLEFLEFTSRDGDAFWDPPRANTSATLPYEEPLSIFLDNISSELQVLINQRPQHEKENQAMDIAFESSLKGFHLLLGSLDYDRVYPYSREHRKTQREPYYEDLGATEDMSGDLIVEAYRRQLETDPASAPYYLRCLRCIGRWREEMNNRAIDHAVAMEYASGRYADDDVPTAYQYFQLDYRDETLTDDAIIGSFFARLGDSANDMEVRRQLWRIGDSRGSEKIKSVAEERVSNVEQALVFLGAERDISDDFIISMYAAKISDNPTSKDLARKAVALIAEDRKSDALFYFLQTGELGAAEMDVGEAFRLLQIPDRTVDDAAILAAFSVCCLEAPEQIESYRKALGIIAQEKRSAMISNTLAHDTAQSSRDLGDWPVGLRNIGNTCYLNSLLQFYFTVKPFRSMVLDFDEFKMPLDDENIAKKQVGSRKVSLAEIKRSQRFINELRLLFRSMISSPDSSVMPEQELARLTLISSTNEAAIRRKSLIASNRHGLGEIHGMPIFGPLGPPAAAMNDRNGVSEDVATKEPETSDADSDITLVSTTAQAGDEATPTDNKENMGPATGQSVNDLNELGNSQAGNATDTSSLGPIGPPKRPPPVPPRPVSQLERQQQIREEVELGAQQDVTEVINNVLFQTQCAIKPIRIDADGEQVDLVKDLFYGRTKSYITAQRGVRSKEELWSDIKIDVATGPRDIYSAIDGAFDVQKVDVEGAEAEQFGAISKLPPILQVQVQRVQFDQVKKTSFKSTHHLELKETIYLDRYMDAHDRDLIERRQESWKWKDEVRELEARKAELVHAKDWEYLPDVFKDARSRIEDLIYMKDDPDTADEAIYIDKTIIPRLAELEEMTRNEIKSIEERERDLNTLIESQFADLRHLPYRLYAVFVHHGSVEFGHYYIYIYDFEKEVWRKYNDSEVSEVHNKAEIFDNHNLQNPPTPYFLVYVNDGIKDRLVQPVCREIAETSPLQPPSEERDSVESEQARTTEFSTENDVEMGDPPAYREIDKTPAGMECHYTKGGNLDGSDPIAASNGAWGEKIADIPFAEW